MSAGAAPAAPRGGLARLWWAQLVSVLGDSCFQGGMPLVIAAMPSVALADKGTALGLVLSAGTLPYLLFALPFGALVDRLDRVRVMIHADLARAAVALALAAWLLWRPASLSLGALGALAFAVSAGSALFNPARDALVPAIVPRAQLFQANALIQTAHQVGPIAGWLLAVAVVEVLGRAHLFTVDSASYVASALLLVGLWRPKAGHAAPLHGSAALDGEILGRPRAGFGADLLEGIREVRRDRSVAALLAITFANNTFIMGPALVAAAHLVKVTWALPDRSFLVFQAVFALGLVCGTGLAILCARRMRRSRLLVLALVWDGLTYVAFGWIDAFPTALGMIFLHALAVPSIVVCRTALLQERVQPHLHGRTFALVGLAVTGATALSLAATGIGVDRFGAHALFVVGGLGGAVTGLCALASPAVRRLP